MVAHRVLIIEDEENLCWFLRESFAARGFEATYRLTGEEGLAVMAEERPDVVILDMNLPGMDGRQVLEKIKNDYAETLVFILTAYDSAELAVECLERGATHYMTKPFDNHELIVRVEKAIAEQLRMGRLNALHRRIMREGRLGEIIGRSEAMKKVFDLIRRIAASGTTTVLLTGETGTGKETAAKAIHNLSPRKDEPFLAVNCTAMPDTLLESELFGHERGAFTGASRQRRGFFELAAGGSLFLDEIGDLSPGAQAKLLRVLQEKKIMRLGGSKDIDVDVRIIAATNRNLEELMSAGRFRDDLFYRLNVYPIHLPPLREREGDALLLARHFISTLARNLGREPLALSAEAEQAILRARWPGNVRQLRNCIERALLLATGERIGPMELGIHPAGAGPNDGSAAPADDGGPVDGEGDEGGSDTLERLLVAASSRRLSVAELEKRYILHLMELHGGHRQTVAGILGLDPKTLYRKLRKYGYGRSDGQR